MSLHIRHTLPKVKVKLLVSDTSIYLAIHKSLLTCSNIEFLHMPCNDQWGGPSADGEFRVCFLCPNVEHGTEFAAKVLHDAEALFLPPAPAILISLKHGTSLYLGIHRDILLSWDPGVLVGIAGEVPNALWGRKAEDFNIDVSKHVSRHYRFRSIDEDSAIKTLEAARAVLDALHPVWDKEIKHQ